MGNVISIFFAHRLVRIISSLIETLPSRHIAPLVSITSGKAAAEDSGEAWICNQSPPEHGPIYIIEPPLKLEIASVLGLGNVTGKPAGVGGHTRTRTRDIPIPMMTVTSTLAARVEMVMEDEGPTRRGESRCVIIIAASMFVVAAAHGAARCTLMQEMVMEDEGPSAHQASHGACAPGCARSGALCVDAGDGVGGLGTHTRRVTVCVQSVSYYVRWVGYGEMTRFQHVGSIFETEQVVWVKNKRARSKTSGWDEKRVGGITQTSGRSPENERVVSKTNGVQIEGEKRAGFDNDQCTDLKDLVATDVSQAPAPPIIPKPYVAPEKLYVAPRKDEIDSEWDGGVVRVGTPTPPSASSPLERKRDGDSSNLPAAKRQCLSTQECPSAKSPIQHPLKRKRDGNSSNLPVAKCQSLSTQERPSTKLPIQRLLKRKRDGNSSDPPTAKPSPETQGGWESIRSPGHKTSESLKKQLTFKRPRDEAEGFAPSKQLRTASPPSILQLPNELLHEIISYVPMEGLKVITQTSSLFKEIAAPHYFVEVDFEVPQPCAFWVAVYPKDCKALLLWRRTRAFSLPENLYFHMMSATDRDLLALDMFFRSLPQFEEISTSVNLSCIGASFSSSVVASLLESIKGAGCPELTYTGNSLSQLSRISILRNLPHADIPSWIQSLTRHPLLEHLTVHSHGQWKKSTSNINIRVNLPSLHFLGGPPEYVLAISRHLETPASVRSLRFSIVDVVAGDAQLPMILDCAGLLPSLKHVLIWFPVIFQTIPISNFEFPMTERRSCAMPRLSIHCSRNSETEGGSGVLVGPPNLLQTMMILKDDVGSLLSVAQGLPEDKKT
ncbi:hypothetical protein BU15DRAFT_66828 [Melanogaster broomeanus]|nr:hypothetical protein BU15DRAFT_66828 [Melanogaster broomeanus]